MLLKGLDSQAEGRISSAKQQGWHTKPILRLYRSLNDIHAQAMMFECEDDPASSYVMYNTLARIYLALIAKHAAFANPEVSSDKLKGRKLCEEAVSKLETLKVQLREMYAREFDQEQRVNEQAAAEAARLAVEKRDREQAEALAASLANLSPVPPQPSTGEASWPVAAAATAVGGAALAAGAAAVAAASTASSLPSMAPMPAFNPAALSRSTSTPSTASVAGASSGGAFPAVSAGALDSAVASHSAYPSDTAIAPPPMPVRSVSEPVQKLRPIHLPSNILPQFYDMAASNTLANIETCAILCGRFDSATGHLWVSHVVAPRQTATADTCSTSDEEQLIEVQTKHDLLTLGWIHTHPSQTCFLSSVDLHTHASYQMMFEEAVAIVLAPKHQPNQGVFHCTRRGMQALTSCSRGGFHKHDEPFPLYGQASHAIWESDPRHAATFIDLRPKPRAGEPHAHVGLTPEQIAQQTQPRTHNHHHGHAH
jgi:STAM-binding protein